MLENVGKFTRGGGVLLQVLYFFFLQTVSNSGQTHSVALQRLFWELWNNNYYALFCENLYEKDLM